MQISVETLLGTTINLDVEPTDTIESVKTRVRNNGFNLLYKWYLAFGCEQLDNGRTLNDFNIGNESILNITPIIFYIRPWVDFGKSLPLISLKVNPWDTVESVKNTIETKTGLKNVRLIYHSKQLEETHPIGD